MDVGLELREARERRGLSLQWLSSTTKISLRVLEAIEASDESRLPALVFTRGFLKSYAAEVGIDPVDTTRRYLEQFEKPVAIEAPVPARDPDRTETWRPLETATPPVAAALHRWSASAPGALRRALENVAAVLQTRLGTAAVLALAALTVLGLALRGRQSQPHAAADVHLAALGDSAPPSPTTAVATSGTAAAVGNSLQMVIAPTGLCWVQATSGDTRFVGALLNAGDRRSFEATSDVMLRVGDPATFAFSINGRPARIAGAPGHAITVRITRDNFAQFFAN